MRIDQGRVGETTSMNANQLMCESTCMRNDRLPLREHLRDVEEQAKDASKPVARHLNLPNISTVQ